jgi:hypothetical protein
LNLLLLIGAITDRIWITHYQITHLQMMTRLTRQLRFIFGHTYWGNLVKQYGYVTTYRFFYLTIASSN